MKLYAFAHDQSAILSPDALEEARSLVKLVPADALEPDELTLLTGFFEARANERGPGTGQMEDRILRALREHLSPSLPIPEQPQSAPDSSQRIRDAELSLEPAVMTVARDAATAELASTSEHDPLLKARALLNSGIAARIGYERSGAFCELQTAIKAHRAAMALCTRHHPLAAAIASALGVSLRLRFEHTGSQQDVEESIELGSRAVRQTPRGDTDWPGRLHNLALAYRARNARLPSRDDVDRAVRLHSEAVEAAGPDHPGALVFLLGLANALVERQDASATERLAKVEQQLERALSSLAANDARRPRVTLSYANMVLRRRVHSFIQGEDGAAKPASAHAVQQVLRMLRACAAVLASDHPDLGSLELTAGMSWQLHGALIDESASLDAALDCFRRAAELKTAPLDTRIRALVLAGSINVSLKRHTEGGHSYAAAVELLHERLPRHLSYSDAQHILSQYPSLARDAAACFLEARDPHRAVEILEAGRGILLAQALRRDNELARLARRDGALATRLEELRAALLSSRRREPEDWQMDPAKALDRAHALANEWDALIAKIRALPGFDDFLRPHALKTLQGAAANGALVYLNVSELRCDAIVVESQGVHCIPLRNLTLETAADLAASFNAALRAANEDALSGALTWLWYTVGRPVLEGMGITQPPQATERWPRLWWIPTGPTAMLPLHAAGQHLAPGQSVIDRVVSSLAPSAALLLAARRRPATSPVRPLVVAVATAPGMRRLGGVTDELATIGRRLPGATTLTEADATRDAVLEAIAHHSWFHFCGHAQSDCTNPAQSALGLYDFAERRLTAAEIVGRDVRADFAYLSACSTAEVTMRAEDESIHLTSAFHVAGFRHVVGTLWPVNDRVATRASELIYQRLADPSPQPDLAPAAVHFAVRDLRAAHEHKPSRWAAYVHVGP